MKSLDIVIKEALPEMMGLFVVALIIFER